MSNNTAKMYIYKMPGKQWHELVGILSVGDRWRELASKHLNYDAVHLEKFANEKYKPSGNPADALLSHWGSKNHTVLELFKKLKEMEHYQAMEAIKCLVDPKYHNLINYNNVRVAQTQSRPMPVPPAVQYAQAQQANMSNLDFSNEKNTPLKKMLVELPNENPILNVEHWDAQKPVEGQDPRVRRQSANYSVASSIIDGAGKIPRNENLLDVVPFEELRECCNGWSDRLGAGGFGEVYKGVRHCQNIAVKKFKKEKHLKLKNSDPKYQQFIDQFKTELRAMHQFPAENILRLMCVSFSEDLSTEPCLVYEFMSEGSLFDRLFKRGKGSKPSLNWDQRLNIATGKHIGLQKKRLNSKMTFLQVLQKD